MLGQLKKTVLLVTHDLDEALYLGDRIVLLSEGRVLANVAPEEFMRSTAAGDRRVCPGISSRASARGATGQAMAKGRAQ